MNIDNKIDGDDNGLQQHSIKIFNIMKCIQHSSPIVKKGYKSGDILKNVQEPGGGITFVYSKFKTFGVIPTALALEELGFNRFTLQKSGSPQPANYMDNNMLVRSRADEDRFCVYNKCRLKDIPSTDTEKIKKFNKTFTQARYIYLDGEMDKKTLNNLVKESKGEGISNQSNTYGQNIMVILGTKVVEVGISFFNVRQIHLMEGWYHYNEMIQVVGRGSRNFSHKRLQKKYRNLMVYLHVGTRHPDKLTDSDYDDGNIIETIDEYLYKKSYTKKKNIVEVEKILKQTSIDCRLNKKGNLYIEAYYGNTLKISDANPIIDAMGKRIKDNIEDKNYSMNCDLGECTLGCEYETKVENVDKDTFSHKHNKKFITQTKFLIKEMFNKKHYYELDELVLNIQKHPDFFGYALKDENKQENDNIVYTALDIIYKNKETIIHKKNKGYITMFVIELDSRENSFYVFQPHIIDEENIKKYSSIHKDAFQNKYNKYNKKIKENNKKINTITKKNETNPSKVFSIKKELESNKILYKKINTLFKSLIEHQDVSIPITYRNKQNMDKISKDIELLNKETLEARERERRKAALQVSRIETETETETDSKKTTSVTDRTLDTDESVVTDRTLGDVGITSDISDDAQYNSILTQIETGFKNIFTLKKWYTFLADTLKKIPYTEHILTIRRYHALDMLTYTKRNIVLKIYLKEIITIDTNLRTFIDNPDPEIEATLSSIQSLTEDMTELTPESKRKDPIDILKQKEKYIFYDTCKTILIFVYTKLTTLYTDDGVLNEDGTRHVHALLTKFVTTFESDHPTRKDDLTEMKVYVITQMIYLFIKYDEKFSTLLLGHFRNISHLQTEFNDTYPEQLIEIIKECIDDKRKSYKSFTDLLSDSTEIPPGITSTEHISEDQALQDATYHCMGDLYEDLPDLMNRLLVCEFFDKNHHLYGTKQNYMIKREVRDKIIPAGYLKKKNHSNTIIAFANVYGGTTSKPKRYTFEESIFMFKRNRKKSWDKKNPLGKIYKKYNFNYNYKKYSYTDNVITAISTTMTPFNNIKSQTSTIDIKLLDKKETITTKKGKKDKKKSPRGMVCRSGPDRMQIAPLLKNIDVILQSKLNYKAYITQLDSIFTGSINTPSKTIISKILQINIDGITSNSTFTIPEDTPII